MVSPNFDAYAARQKAVISNHPEVWQHVPTREEHLLQVERDRMANEGADPSTPKLGYPLTNHGGSTITTPKLALVYLGPWWSDTAKIEAFAGDLMTAGYLAPLGPYGSGQGRFLGSFKGPTATGTVTDAQLQSALTGLIAAHTVPPPDANTLYALLLPEGVSSTQGGSASCSAYCGYHDSFTYAGSRVYYSVQPASDCQGCNAGDAFAAFCAVLAHEVAEACTDAIPGNGWYNEQTGMENADEWAWVFGAYGPWTVQGYQLNGIGNSLNVIKYQQQQPQPPPQQLYTLAIQGPQSPVAGTAVNYVATLQPPTAGTTYSWTPTGGGNGPGIQVTWPQAGSAVVTCSAETPDGHSVSASLSVQVQSQQPQPPPTHSTSAFWDWLFNVGKWGHQATEDARTAEAPVVLAQLHRYYPNVVSPPVADELSVAPPPPPTNL
jgi:hypothetical protein